MANTKISALTAATVPAGTDEIPMNQGGTSKKIDRSVWGVYGGLVSSGASEQTLAETTPEKLEGFTANLPASNTTPAFGTNQITATVAGDYAVAAQLAFSGNASKTYYLEVRIDDVVTGIRTERKLGTGGDTGSCSLVGIITLAASEVVTLWVETDASITPGLTVAEAQLTISLL